MDSRIDIGAIMNEEIDLSTEEEVIEPVVEAKTETKSMDDTIRETLEQINTRGQETEEQAEQRLRDEKGRFAKKSEENPPEIPVEPTETLPEEPKVITEPSVSPELQKLGLRKEEAEAISANPVAMQAFIRRSEEMHKGLEQYKEKAQFADVIGQVLSPYMHTIQAAGVHPAQAVQHLFAADHALRYGNQQQKLDMMHKIARDYGIDISQAQEYSASQPQVDPQVDQLKSELQQMRSWIQQQNQAREWQERQQLDSEIERFKSDPSHIYFEQVRGDMAGLLQAGLASDLKDAYEKAIYANSTVRSQVLAKQQAEDTEKAKREAAQKAQAAKQAAAVNVPKKGSLPAKKPVGSMEDTIREKAIELGII
jgi:hypothetical protein